MMLIKKSFLFLVVILLMASCQKDKELTPQTITESSGSVSLRESHDLCFTSYNIHSFCEDFVGTTLTPADVVNICQGLRDMDSDVINLQEVWCEEVKDAISDCLADSGYTNFVYDAESGLMTLSKYRLESEQNIKFTSESGTDRFKNKGFTSTIIELEEGCEFNIINTHLQADGGGWDKVVEALPWNWFGPSEEEIREEQLEQIEDFVHDLPDCLPSIIGGDFNIDTDSDEFENIVDILPGKPTFILSGDTRVPPTSHSGSTLDYFFLSNFSSYYSNLSNNTVLNNCIESYTIERFNLVEIQINSFPISFSVIGTFDTMAEAQAAKSDAEGNAPPFVFYFIDTEEIVVCIQTFENPSDHNPIETCFTYDCAEQEDCNEPVIVDEEDDFGGNCVEEYHCPPHHQCINGNCVPW